MGFSTVDKSTCSSSKEEYDSADNDGDVLALHSLFQVSLILIPKHGAVNEYRWIRPPSFLSFTR